MGRRRALRQDCSTKLKVVVAAAEQSSFAVQVRAIHGCPSQGSMRGEAPPNVREAQEGRPEARQDKADRLDGAGQFDLTTVYLSAVARPDGPLRRLDGFLIDREAAT